MSSRSLMALLLLAALQGGLLIVEERCGEPADSTGRSRLVSVDRDRIDGIALQRQGGPLHELRRRGQRWELKRPVEEPADPEAVESILSAIEFVESWRGAPQGVSARQLGLDPPVLRMVVAEGERRQELRLGASDASQQGVYLEVGGARHVVPRSFLEVLSRAVDEIRDRTLVRLRGQELRAVTRTGEGALRLARDASGGWWLEEAGRRLPAAPQPVERLVGALLALRAVRFLPGEPAAPRALVRVEAAGGSRAELRLGGACPGRPAESVVAVRRPPRWVATCVEADDLSPLHLGTDVLQDLALTHLEEPQLSEIRVTGRSSGQRLVLRRDAGLWRLPDGSPGEADEIRAWLESLRSLRGRLEETDREGEPAALAIIELLPETGAGQRLIFGAAQEDGAGLVAWREGTRGALLRLDPEARALLSTDPLRFRGRELWRFSVAEVRGLGLEGPEGSIELVHPAEGWTLRRPAGRTLDSESLQRLLEVLARLRAVRFLAAGEVRPWPARLRVRLELDPEPLSQDKAPRVHALELGGSLGGERCRGRAGKGPPFELETSDCRALLGARLLRDR